MPHVICIGAQRAATTWLFNKLRDCCWNVADDSIKEVHYFNHIWLPWMRHWTTRHRRSQAYESLQYLIRDTSYDDLSSNLRRRSQCEQLMNIYLQEPTDRWYRENVMVNHGSAERLSFDFTPEYALLPKPGIEHIEQLCPDARYLYVLRDPIQRAYSHLLKLSKEGSTSLAPQDIATYIDANPDIVDRSNYRVTIDNYCSLIGANRLRILIQEDMVSEPDATIRSLAQWLAIEDCSTQDKGLEIHEHISRNRRRYNRNEIEQLKTVFWERFSHCYNNLKDLPGIPTAAWRVSAETFLEGLCEP